MGTQAFSLVLITGLDNLEGLNRHSLEAFGSQLALFAGADALTWSSEEDYWRQECLFEMVVPASDRLWPQIDARVRRALRWRSDACCWQL